MPQTNVNDITAIAYEHFAPYVRGKLAKLGVRDADLPDLCHEVFLIVHDKGGMVPDVDRVDLWLREICRRVAAGYRRRSGNKLEILGRDLDREAPAPVDDAPDAGAGTERREQLALVRKALNRLDDESRDLLALHDVGELPLTELARLVDHDRKTVRKRLQTARRRVSRLICQDGSVVPLASADTARITPPQSPLMQVQAAKGRAHGCTADELDVIHVSDARTVGVIGNVTIATWRRVTPETLDSVLQLAPKAVERCGGELVYLALIEPGFEPPSLVARQRIVDALEIVGPYISAFALAPLGDTESISQAIISGMMLLARPRFPMRSFAGIETAASWLCGSYARGAHGALTPGELGVAAQRLLALRPQTRGYP
jgi:RNA polymerase sigma-70 factor (ECF subfamily)